MPTKREEGTDYPKSAYLYTPDDEPSHWKIRVRTPSGAVDRTQLGPAHAALTVGYRGNKAVMPADEKRACLAALKRLYEQAGMAWPEDTGMSTDGDLVYRSGLIFRSGTYEDKGVTVTVEDLDAAVAAFTEPVDAEIEHLTTQGIKTFLDGKVGKLVRIWREGDALFGTMAVPAWLDPFWGEAGRKVSIVWQDAARAIRRIGMVLSPRVEDAAVMSAYTAFAVRHDTPHGQSTLQAVHDLAARSGAICSPRDGTGFVSRHESTGMQGIHDLSVDHGAQCPASDTARANGYYSAAFAGQRHSATDAADIQQIHDLANRQGAACASTGMSTPAGRTGMYLDSIAFWKKLGPRAREQAVQEGIKTVPPEEVFTLLGDAERDEREQVRREMEVAFSARIKEAEAREQQAQQQLFAATAQRLQGEAAAFADGLVTGHKLLPAEREGLIAALTQAGMDDAQHGAVTFASGQQGSRVEQIKAMYAARPAHDLTREQLDGRGTLTVMGANRRAAGADDISDEKLLGLTATGRAALARRKQA